MEYKIRNFTPKNRIFLSPMLEPNDPAFRWLCHKAGCGLVFTGMFHPQTKQEIFLEEKPAMQIVCNSTNGLKEFIERWDSQVSMWDLNLGCPSPLARKNQFGVFLQETPNKIEEILGVMRRSTEKPISIKLRKSDKTLEIIKMAEKYVDAVTIHPRTKDQGYSGKPDIEFAELVKKSTKLPVIYSGNVNKNNLKEMLEKFDFVMVGRETLGNPEYFKDLTGEQHEKKNLFLEYLELAKKYNLKFAQIKFQAMNFTKGLSNAKEVREKLIYVKTIEEIEEVFKKYTKP